MKQFNSILAAALLATVVACGTAGKKQVKFTSENKNLSGDVFYPKGFDSSKKYSAILVVGSWTTVKEQMASTYAQKLADAGYVSLVFDFRNYGKSEGEPRYYESPKLKVEDIKNAVTYLQGLDYVDDQKIGAFAVCAGAGYVLSAAADDTRIKAVVTAASWLHDGEAVKLFYGGDKGVKARIAAAKEAKKIYASTGEVKYVPTISKTDKNAAMYGPYDYYLNPKRGAIKEWSADKFAVMSWEDWLTFNPMPTAKKLNVPTLMIHSDGAVLPNYTKKYFENIKTADKKLHWINSGKKPPFEQFDFYDKPENVDLSARMAAEWFGSKLGA